MYERELETLNMLAVAGLFDPDFYQAHLAKAVNNPFSSYDAFQTIPFMRKAELRSSTAYERTSTKSEDVFGVFSSSGTSGDKTFYVYSDKDRDVHRHFVQHYLGKLGIGPKDLGGVMAPVGTGVMAHTMLWEFEAMGAGYVNCPNPSPQNMAKLIENLPITVIATRPDIAAAPFYSPDLQDCFRSSSVNTLIVGGGFLSEQKRFLIERVWSARCYNLFGMSEMFGPMAAECPERNGLHYLNEYLMIEVVDPDTKKPVEPGDPGVAVYTTLWDKGFPLLRYWTDDVVCITYDECPCGDNAPRLRFLGRIADSISLEGSRYFPTAFEEILYSKGYFGDYLCIKDEDKIRVFFDNSYKAILGSAEAADCARQFFGHDVLLEGVDDFCALRSVPRVHFVGD